MKGSKGGSCRNTGSSVRLLNSLRNHCQQHLVALFAPALHLRGGKRIHGTRAINIRTITGRQLRARGDVDRVFLSLRKHCASCCITRNAIRMNSRALLVGFRITGHGLPLGVHRSPLMGYGLPLSGNGLPLRDHTPIASGNHLVVRDCR